MPLSMPVLCFAGDPTRTPRRLDRWAEQPRPRCVDEARSRDFIEEYPQSGERIRGKENQRALVENFPGGLLQPMSEATIQGEEWIITPAYRVVRVTTSGDTASGVKVRYPDGSAPTGGLSPSWS